MNEVAKIKFGEVSFEFFTENNVDKFLKENNVEIEKLIPTASSWYLQVLGRLDLNHEKEKRLKVVFSLRDKIEDFDFVSGSPLRYRDKEVLLRFGVKVE